MPSVRYATKEDIEEIKYLIKEVLEKIEFLESSSLKRYSHERLYKEGEDAEELFEI